MLVFWRSYLRRFGDQATILIGAGARNCIDEFYNLVVTKIWSCIFQTSSIAYGMIKLGICAFGVIVHA